MIRFRLFFILLLPVISVTSQTIEQELSDIEKSIQKLDSERLDLQNQREILKLQKIQLDMAQLGFPSDDLIKHSGMTLSYNEEREQANWVMHMILPDVEFGSVYRTNDFREDPLVITGSAVQQDYFLTDTSNTGEVSYDGYGYDRGHLAPSADFRWSRVALSESYLYSNMSPQLPNFNRETWAALEDHLRKYVIDNSAPLYVITAPIFMGSEQKLKRSINQLSIPTGFLKIAIDPMNEQGIAFFYEHQEASMSMESKAITIDEAEQFLGYDVFPLLNKFEDSITLDHWFDLSNQGLEPLAQDKLPRSHFNTVVAGKRINKQTIVCGNVVSSKISRSGHLWLNLDKPFPNQEFSIFIRDKDLTNFTYMPGKFLLNKNVCFEGKVKLMNNTPIIELAKENRIRLLQSRLLKND